MFVEGQPTYKWYGRVMGDYPLPAGVTLEELGHCVHAITLPPTHEHAAYGYEMGVVRKADGTWTILYDFWGMHDDDLPAYIGGLPMQAIVGEDLGLFKQAYGVELAKSELALEGWQVNEILAADGSIELVATQ